MIAAFTRLDLSSWFLRTQTALTLLLVVAVGILLPVPGMAIIAAALVTSLMVSAPFLADEREHLNTLYGVLPVSRRTVVTGRALSIVTYYIAAAALATLVTVISATVRGGRIEPEVLLIAHAVGVAFIGLSMALQLPVFFRIGYSRGRLMAYAPAFIVVGLAWLLQTTRLHIPLVDAFANVAVVAIVGIGALIGVIGIVVGIVVSARGYREREL